MNKLNVLYEDNHIIVVVKPYNVLSQGDSTKDISIMDMVKDYLKKKYNKPGNVYLGLVHRLDRPVGGVMVFAKTSKAASRLCASFNRHEIKKQYLAIVHGKMNSKGKFVDNIGKDSDGNAFISENGKEAILEYEVLNYDKENDCSLVSIDLKTGRHHQIRIQFASRGHYLLGDQRYGVQDNMQIALFAYKLEFVHPVTKKCLSFCVYPEKKDYWTIFTL
ncbi:MAG: RluA family pseudouridine synthase [Bacilli bacterium]|nr:RluA family pseudouridine synthase [Bacilli bacterium]